MVLGSGTVELPPANSAKQPIPSTDTDLDDEADRALRALGYNPVFKRKFTKWSAFSFALSISGTL
jgi:hypothetical protein